jgi:hypothetical protein
MPTPLALARPPGDVRAPAQCLNCAAPLAGPFCAQCGQKDHALTVSLRHLFDEFVEDYFHFDSKLPRTLALLVARPGQLTREFVEGKRVKYVGPFKLYVLCSVLFFLAAAVMPNVHRGAQDAPNVKSDVKVDFDKVGDADPVWVRAFSKQLKARYEGQTPQQIGHHAADALTRYMPDAMLVLVPVFALMLKLLWRKRFYAEHFVTALHMHAAGFLAILFLAVNQLPTLNLVVLLAFFGHSALVLRRVYAQGWFKTLLKLGFATGAYTFAVAFAIAAVALGGLLLGS